MISASNHMMLENTLPSMKAAFEAGADVLKLDVHLCRWYYRGSIR
ncbi:MAG: glycerophosphodiester phosphodiesterase family protein [Cohaesibacter sp.]|nr:glycerophosphodiester phosphodiesterase family protein [Cohaesibacter sp.]